MNKIVLALCLVFNFTYAVAQNAADRDTTFKMHVPLNIGYFNGSNPYNEMAIQADGKVIYIGGFYNIGGSAYSGIMRLNTDGSFDNTFNAGNKGAAGIVAAVALQNDGKILIGGGFTQYSDSSRSCIARLNNDGALDNSFDIGTGASGIYYPLVRSLDIQTDGKIIAAGAFTRFNGTSIAGIARLNTNGSLDTSFNPGTGPNHIIEVVKVLPSGKILVAGQFGSFNGYSQKGLVRLNNDGTVDETFVCDLNASSNSPVLNIALQNDGKILLVGSFSADGANVDYRGIVRLMPDGELDETFILGSGPAIGSTGSGNGHIYGLDIAPDGKILLAGWFSKFSEIERGGVIRLLPSGAIDEDFNSNPGMNAARDIKFNPSDSKIYACSGSEEYNGESLFNYHTAFSGHIMHVIRLMGDGGGNTSDENYLSAYRNLNVNIYPNPAQNQVSFSPISNGTQISIFDINGKMIMNSIAFNQDIVRIETSNFVNGIYLVRIENNEQIQHNKLIISH